MLESLVLFTERSQRPDNLLCICLHIITYSLYLILKLATITYVVQSSTQATRFRYRESSSLSTYAIYWFRIPCHSH